MPSDIHLIFLIDVAHQRAHTFLQGVAGIAFGVRFIELLRARPAASNGLR
jgi:hypothetical protein